MISTLYQYEYLEFSFEQRSSVESKEKENSWPLNDFLGKLKKSEVWSKNIGKIINELNDSQIQPLKSDLIKKWYSDSVDTTYRKESIFIEYIKYDTKIVERNNTSFEKVLEWYTKNSKSGTTKNERRFLQAYLYINGHFDTIASKKSLIDECDGIIWSKTQEAITHYKNNKNKPRPEINHNPIITAENKPPANNEAITEWSLASFDHTNKESIRSFQSYFNTFLCSSLWLSPIAVDGQRWPKTKQAVKYCWEKGVRVWWEQQTPLFADEQTIIPSLFERKFGSGVWYNLIKQIGDKQWDSVTLMKRMLALAKHEGNFAFGRKNWDASNEWYSKGTFQIFDKKDVEGRYNSLFNKTIAKYNLNNNNLTSADKDIIARVGHIDERGKNRSEDLWAGLSDKNKTASELAPFISTNIQGWRSPIGINVATRTMPPSETVWLKADPNQREWSFVYNYA